MRLPEVGVHHAFLRVSPKKKAREANEPVRTGMIEAEVLVTRGIKYFGTTGIKYFGSDRVKFAISLHICNMQERKTEAFLLL